MILLLGHNGQLGQCILRTFLSAKIPTIIYQSKIDAPLPSNRDYHSPIPPDILAHKYLTILHPSNGDTHYFGPTFKDDLTNLLRQKKSEITHIINAAAYTDVAGAEDSASSALLHSANVALPAFLAYLSQHFAIPLFHFSTDYVFHGDHVLPYDENDPPDPINAYGASKLQGEKEVYINTPYYYIFRISWLVSPPSISHNNFVGKVLHKLRYPSPKDPQDRLFPHQLSIPNDQVASVTYAPDVADLLLSMLPYTTHPNRPMIPHSLYHYASSTPHSWYDLALEIQGQYQDIDPNIPHTEILPIQTPPTPPLRPKYSFLSSQRILEFNKFLNIPYRDYTSILRDYMNDLKNQDKHIY